MATTISGKRQIVIPKKIEDGPRILGYKGRKATLADIKKGIVLGAAKSR